MHSDLVSFPKLSNAHGEAEPYISKGHVTIHLLAFMVQQESFDVFATADLTLLLFWNVFSWV